MPSGSHDPYSANLPPPAAGSAPFRISALPGGHYSASIPNLPTSPAASPVPCSDNLEEEEEEKKDLAGSRELVVSTLDPCAR